MIEIAVIGLGAMGSALARAQLKGGHSVTVWNRTATKAEPLVARGATLVDTAAGAARAAEIVLICVDTYASADGALDGVWQANGLAGRTVVQLGTGSPDEARAFAAKVEAAGGHALDGSIMCYPTELGPDSDELIMFGGAEAGFDAAKPALQRLSRNLEYLGDNIAAPAVLDTAMLSISLALYAGVVHAARICECEGVEVADLARLDLHGDLVTPRLEVISANAFELGRLHDGGALGVWADVAGSIHGQLRRLGIASEVAEALARFYRRAVAAGHGPEDVTALIKLLRQDR